jgi:hypothetical protein
LNISHKIFAILIYKKLSDGTELMTSDCQIGFRHNRSKSYQYITMIFTKKKRFLGLEICNRKVAFMSFKQLFSFWTHLIVLPCQWLLTVRKLNYVIIATGIKLSPS